MPQATPERLFWKLYRAATEEDVNSVVSEHPEVFSPTGNWKPYGGNKNNFGVVENQQANPIAALIEKITNSIDSILTKRCYEEGIAPKSSAAPQSVDEAVRRFFPDSKHWDLPQAERKQAENIQIVAHGPRMNTSLVIYDDGEGQRPDDFASTFLSLLTGNKNDIPFVQGKYNMGGSGAIVFCGKKRYQLVASKRYDGGNFGFTLVRKHPLSKAESGKVKNTWYEYLTIGGKIPQFPIDELALGLRGRNFKTGTVLKLYSYQLPPGSRSVISRDLNQSINEYLFEPALPVFTIDNNQRYPDDRNTERSLYGLKRRLENSSEYIHASFSEDVSDWGGFKITCYVFNFRAGDKGSKDTKAAIRREFFKNNMSVLFSLNGQVHGSYSYEFVSRALKFNLLKEHVLIHVDCSNLEHGFRSELFMASRDRMKGGGESSELRGKVAEVLKRGQLKEIHNHFRSRIAGGEGDTGQLLKEFSKNLPLDSELTKLLKHTMNLKNIEKGKPKDDSRKSPSKAKPEQKPYEGLRFPATFNVNTRQRDEGIPVVQIPKGIGSSIRFNTDVADDYFDRVEEPGKLELALAEYNQRGKRKGSKPQPDEIGELLSVSIASPKNGTIKVHTKPLSDLQVGDSIKIRANLTNPVGDDLEQLFWVKIVDKPQAGKKPGEAKPEDLGLPALVQVREKEAEDNPDVKTWESLEDSGIEFEASKILHLLVEGDKLECVYVNMDSNVLKRLTSKQKGGEQINLVRNKYISSVYFHVLFLYMISKNKKYQLEKEDGSSLDLQDYLQDVFASSYAEFLINFDTSLLLDAVAD